MVDINNTISDLQATYADWLATWKKQREKFLNQKGLLNFYEDFDEV